MEKDLNNLTKEDLILKIKQLQKEKKLNHNKYGLVWDTEKEPEQVVELCENNIPILKNIKTKDIKTDNSQDNILIEGDNYHALQVLNYTHKNKIDVIYIDPPYNTGNKDFKYNDTFVDKEDGYKHSKWLNFMSKRLELAKNLLKDSGVIFISIDDNEQANLKLLCDKIFNFKNYISTFFRKTKSMTGDDGNGLNIQHDYVLIYAKDKSNVLFTGEQKNLSSFKNPDNDPNGEWCSGDPSAKSGGESTYFPIKNPITGQKDFPPKGRFWSFSKETLKEYIKIGKIKFKQKKLKNQRGFIFKRYKKDLKSEQNSVGTLIFDDNSYMNQVATKELKNIIDVNAFNYPKPIIFIKTLIQYISKQNSIILDFFAGSGTTGHAVLDLNKKDGGNRKFILCTNNENNICTEVCYPRIQKAIKGYKQNSNGEFIEELGGNLKYFKTDLISVERIDKITDSKRKELTQKAGEIIGIKEDTLQEIEINNYYQILSNNTKTKFTAIYFRESEIKLEELINKIKNKKTVLYVFSYGKVDRKMYKELSKNISIEDIPQPILDIYKELNLKFED